MSCPSTSQSLFHPRQNNLFHLIYFPPIAIPLSSFLLPSMDAVPSWQNNSRDIFSLTHASRQTKCCQYSGEKDVLCPMLLLLISMRPCPNQIQGDKDAYVYRSESL